MRSRVPRQRHDSPSRRAAGGGCQIEGEYRIPASISTAHVRSSGYGRPRGGRYFIYRPPGRYSKHRPHPAPRAPSASPQAAGVLDDKQRRPASVVSREVLLLRTEDAPQILHLASAWRSRRGPPRRGHAPRAVCLVRRGCSPPSFRGRRLLLFNRAGVHAKVAYRVVVAAAPCAEGGRAPCRARAVGGGRWPASPAATTGPAFAAALESRPIPVCLPLRSNGPGEGAKGLRSSPSTTPGVRRQLPLLPIWPRSGNTGTRSLLGLARVCPVLSLAADDAGGRAAGKPTILRAEKIRNARSAILSSWVPSRAIQTVRSRRRAGEAVPGLRHAPLRTVHQPAQASKTMIAAMAESLCAITDQAWALLTIEELPSWVAAVACRGRGRGAGEEDGKYLANQLGICEFISAAQSAIQRLQETRGWTVFHLPSTRSVFEIPSSPRVRAHRPSSRPASSTAS